MTFPFRQSTLLFALIIAFLGNQLSRVYAENTITAKRAAGPQLLIDDSLIQSSSNVIRKPVTLVREKLSANPILTASNHLTFQPFFTVIRDTNSGIFRMWYGIRTEDLNTVRSRLAYIESNDGIHWTNAPRILDVGPIQFGTSVIDEGPQFSPALERYKLGWYFEKGLKIATSPDGLNWKPLTPEVLIEHNHDINGIFWDSFRKKYSAILSYYIPGDAWPGKRRITKLSTSTNLRNWSEPQSILTPDANDEGETQFYAMDGFLARGEFLVGMVKVLRDDLKADDPPQPTDAYGIGYTTVAWTRDGREWSRERIPFLERNPKPGTWDHAHAWIDEQVPVGDEVFLYYAGYKSGHKVNRFEERQIGLIKMKRDRYIARRAVGLGTLRTVPMILAGRQLLLNADASKGEIRIQLLEPDGKPLRGYTFNDCNPGRADSVDSVVQWRSKRLPTTPVMLEFSLKDSALFGFEAR